MRFYVESSQFYLKLKGLARVSCQKLKELNDSRKNNIQSNQFDFFLNSYKMRLAALMWQSRNQDAGANLRGSS